MRIAKRFRIGYLEEYLAKSRLHIETKTLSQPVEFHQEILQTVKKHYGHVPARWLYAYAHGYLTEHLMPYLQGIHADGWASQRASVFLRGDWRHYQYLFLEGTSPRKACPMSLRIAVGDHMLHETITKEAAFCIRERLWGNDLPSNESGIVEVDIYADSSFAPQAFGVNDDTRTLAYQVRRLSLVDGQGGELVLYSDRKARLFRLVLPVLVLWKSLLINHDIPYTELGRDLRRLRSSRKRFLLG
jgi:hypothetical protein